jgi:rhodanese-related sulfurtransferase
MNRFPKFSYLFLALFLAFVGCSSDDDNPVTPSVNEAIELNKAIEGSDGGYMSVSCPAIVKADIVHEELAAAKNYLIDIRSAADYANGHVEGAVNVAAGDILTHVGGIDAAGYDKIVIICYTGQTAGFVTAILRLSGYANAYSMKYGMSSWNAVFDKVTTNCTSDYLSVFTAAPANKAAATDLPVISTGKATGADILTDRINTVLAAGFGECAITASTVMADPTQYYIVNYWSLAHYTDLKHIPGSIQYTPRADLKFDTFLKTLPTDKTIVIYCYTGQTSANVATILRIMGYDAKTLKFGTNAMIYSTMKAANATHFDASRDIGGYTYVQ